VRTIGILGASFCGSTVVTSILDGIPGVAGVGETHWVLDDTNGDWHCRQCGPDCEYITPEFIGRCQVDFFPWWEKWARQFRVDVVVASEKWWKNYERLGAPDQALVVYREPAAWCVSWLHHQRVKEADVVLAEIRPTPAELEAAAKTWTTCYNNALDWVAKRGAPAVALPFEDLITRPSSTFHWLCGRLDLPAHVDALDYKARDHHQIRGNAFAQLGVVVRKDRPRYLREKQLLLPSHLAEDKRHLRALKEDQIEAINESEPVRATLARLEAV
jgi:hypothetical protein